VGRQVLMQLLDHPAVGEVLSIGRRETPITHDKLREIVHTDFLDLAPLAGDLAGVDVCFHCLGTYQSQVSRRAYARITCDYLAALSDALAAASPLAVFVLFSAQGARPEGKGMYFARVKGKAENLLNETTFPRKYIFRPGHIQPTHQRRPPGLMYRYIALPMMARKFAKNPEIGVTDRDLAKAMVTVGLAGTEDSKVFSNRMIRQVAGADQPGG
jgi:uncharacterized protein YbjT (DUF2867 family)